jgi:hypothetical protein
VRRKPYRVAFSTPAERELDTLAAIRNRMMVLARKDLGNSPVQGLPDLARQLTSIYVRRAREANRKLVRLAKGVLR